MKIISFLCLIVVGATSFAQSFEPQYNHDAFAVTNLEKSASFFKKVLSLNEVENPVNNPNIRWFSLGGTYQLHLIQVEAIQIVPNKAHHLALTISDMEEFVSHLHAHKIPFEDWLGEKQKIQLRPDGVQHIYIQDPDGNWIEINDAK